MKTVRWFREPRRPGWFARAGFEHLLHVAKDETSGLWKWEVIAGSTLGFHDRLTIDNGESKTVHDAKKAAVAAAREIFTKALKALGGQA